MQGRHFPKKKRCFTALISISILTILALSAQASGAQEKSQSIMAAPAPAAPHRDTAPFKIFGGIGAGYGSIFGSDFHQSMNGTQYLVSGLLSYETHRWVFDGGVSWLYNKVSGSDALNRGLHMRTRSGTADFSPRYRLSSHWQLGPSLNIAFGTDTSYSPSIGAPGSNYFAGIRSVYEIYADKYPLRFWQQLSTDVSIRDRQSIFGMIGVQIGIPISVPRRSNALAEAAPLQQQPIAVSGVQKQSLRDVSIVLDSQRVFFGTNSARLRPTVKRLLRSIAQYLQTQESNWRSLDIAGHADQRGRFEYNLTLSQKRALSVRNAITLDEIPAKKIKVEAYSYLKPLDARNNQAAWAKNRRVELTFHDVKDAKTLAEKLKPLAADSPLPN